MGKETGGTVGREDYGNKGKWSQRGKKITYRSPELRLRRGEGKKKDQEKRGQEVFSKRAKKHLRIKQRDFSRAAVKGGKNPRGFLAEKLP